MPIFFTVYDKRQHPDIGHIGAKLHPFCAERYTTNGGSSLRSRGRRPPTARMVRRGDTRWRDQVQVRA
ncbi:pyruvate kinase [Anopheles sinensis]|uniref:Pyruvate kinase n=1 Tax=Anopheles sinensis TaxID=74873 RepID=A0A084VW48_ANOSI|nr:pyruvate kinase [Anopheles sinensis]